MRVYTDYISGDEFMSDSYPSVVSMEEACLEVKAKYVTKGAEHVDIGANPSAEGGDDDGADDAAGETVIDIQDKFNLQEVQGFSKAEFLSWARGYLKKVTARLNENNPDRVPGFKKGATELVKLIAGKFSEMQIFTGEKMDYDGAFCFAYQKEQEDEGPTFLFFKDGLKEMKY